MLETPDGETLARDVPASKLGSVNWDFREARSRNDIHSIHPYPTKFVPHIPRELIRLFHPGDASAVLDPFCGSGTTLVEANVAGLPAVGIDLNPIAMLIAKVKTTPLERSIRPLAQALTSVARKQHTMIPDIPRLGHWFLPAVQQALANLLHQVTRVEEPDLRDALKVALSSIIVRVSNQESDTRYAAIGKQVTSEQVYQLFCQAAASLDGALTEMFGGLFPCKGRSRVLCRNVLEVHADEIGRDIGLVVTSPPYPNAYESWLYHKYRMYWLGMDPVAVRAAEIGARPHYFRKNPQTELDFENQMGRCFELLAKVMRPSSAACFVIGRSVIHGRRIDNVSLIERAAAPHGFRRLSSAVRRIPSNRKSFNPAVSTINHESVLILALEGV